MRAIGSRRYNGRGAWIALLAATAVAAGGCAKQPAPAVQQAAVQQVGPRPTPAPNFLKSVDSIPPSELLAYAHGLQFDSTSAGADAQYIVLRRGKGLVLGPFLAVAPEIGAEAITHQQLAQGRILARLKVSATARGFALPAGVYYVWVDSTARGFRGLLVSEAASARVWQAPVRPESYGLPGGAEIGVAIARIVTTEAGGFSYLCIPCSGLNCHEGTDSLH